MLTESEKSLLRQALFDGKILPNGIIRTLTQDDFETVANMPDDEIRAKLVSYKADRISFLEEAISKLNTDILKLQDSLQALNEVVIND